MPNRSQNQEGIRNGHPETNGHLENGHGKHAANSKKPKRVKLDDEIERGFFSDFICLVCGKTVDKLLHTVCGHKLCENCKAEMFKSKQEQTSSCPFCGRALRKRDISEKSQEELFFENEMRVRQMLLLEFSEVRADFETEEEYNDYLEYFEDVGNCA